MPVSWTSGRSSFIWHNPAMVPLDGERDELLGAVYDELRQLAERRLASEGVDHTLQPTALVHEAFLRLLDPSGGARAWDSEAHYFGAAARAMRRILIDHARAKGAQKRGGGRAREELDLDRITLEDVPDTVLDLDPSLQRLAVEEPSKAELVTLRFYAGLSLPQAASVLGISISTAERHWAYCRAWLLADLQREL